jgi:hypothetical protein
MNNTINTAHTQTNHRLFKHVQFYTKSPPNRISLVETRGGFARFCIKLIRCVGTSGATCAAMIVVVILCE